MIVPKTKQTTAAVAAHYDQLDRFYRDIWGEHLHHGYWATGRESQAEAVLALIELVAQRLCLSPGLLLCDIGCGYGATARRLAERHGVRVTGVTVSAAQADRAAQPSAAAGGVTVHKRDWLDNRFADASFDRAYAIESSEHMPDKRRFFDEAFRTLRPGGLLAVCAWLSRVDPRAWEIRRLLEPICREGRLTGMGEEAEYQALAERAGFRTVSFEDLSRRVGRTWSICARRALKRVLTEPRYARFLLDRQAGNRVFALTLMRLPIAYRTGSLRYGIMVFAKP